jgi:cell division protein FtsL
MRYQSIKKVRHYVYENIEDYKLHNPDGMYPLSDWRDAEEGDWVFADDKCIVQLLKVSNSIDHPNDRKNYKYAKGWVRTVVGTFLNRRSSYMDTDFDAHKNRYTFSKTIKNPSSRVRKRKKVTNKEKVFTTNVAVGMGAVRSYMDAFSEPSVNKAEKKSAVLLKQRRIMQEIEKSVLDIAKEMGIDHRYILSSLKTLAESTEDENVALQSIKELGKSIGTLGGGTKKIETGIIGMFQGFSPEQLESADRSKLIESAVSDVKE